MRHALDQETRITQHTSRKMRRGWREREWVKEGEWRQTEREIQRDKERVQICLLAAYAQSVTNNNSHSEISREPERHIESQSETARQCETTLWLITPRGPSCRFVKGHENVCTNSFLLRCVWQIARTAAVTKLVLGESEDRAMRACACVCACVWVVQLTKGLNYL